MNVEVTKKDIFNIGMVIEKNGKVGIAIDTKIALLSGIVLKSVLKCFGDYKIVDSDEILGNNCYLVRYYTDLPYEELDRVD